MQDLSTKQLAILLYGTSQLRREKEMEHYLYPSISLDDLVELHDQLIELLLALQES